MHYNRAFQIILLSVAFSSSLLSIDCPNCPNHDNLTLKESSMNDDDFDVLTLMSPNSFWAGATLAYNFEGEGTDNFIGGAQIKLESISRFQDNPYFDLLVVGNLSKITSSIGENSSDDISELIQSNQGLSIGLSPIFVLNKKRIEQGNALDVWRLYGHLGYKVNGFQDVGLENKTININQFRLSFGLEFEGLHVTSGPPINISSELVYGSFEEDKYYEVFNESVSSIVAWENSLIIPIGNNVGFLAKYTISNKGDNVFQAGLILQATN